MTLDTCGSDEDLFLVSLNIYASLLLSLSVDWGGGGSSSELPCGRVWAETELWRMEGRVLDLFCCQLWAGRLHVSVCTGRRECVGVLCLCVCAQVCVCVWSHNRFPSQQTHSVTTGRQLTGRNFQWHRPLHTFPPLPCACQLGILLGSALRSYQLALQGIKQTLSIQAYGEEW